MGVSVVVGLGLLLSGSVALAASPVVADAPPPFAGAWRRPDGGLVRVGRDASSAFLMDFASRRRWRLEPRGEGLWSLEGSRPAALAVWRAPTLTLSGVAAGALVLEPVPVRTEELSLRSGDVTLSATLWLPAGGPPRHAVVLLHEAGQGTRESLEPYPAFLVEQGLAVLTFDARGTGRSTGDSQPWESGVRERAVDGLVAARLLRERVAPGGAVGLMGFGQGAWTAVSAAAQSPEDVGFLVLVSGGGGAVWKQEQHRMRNEGRRRGLTGPELVDLTEFLDVLYDARLYTDEGAARALKTLDFQLQRAKRKRWYAVTAMPPFKGLPVARFLDVQRKMWRNVLSYDAAEDLRRVRGPVLALLGERDETTPASLTARALNRGLKLRPGAPGRALVKVIARADHWLAEPAREDQPGVEVVTSDALDTLSAWLRALER
ncbi:alpha/beta hydrolase [Myxococcus sp. CA056]|uniref:alpha/beta hydrolase n=1 Tax=unclassified Myxococcus TaxID=2648731 RepID=UPI00157B0510|nr:MULTISPECIES: CocE/NonD family hydrolase [unclassified Myxococcus]NTX10954.1 alpha/beta hydrolase [Myxococcus sp. CA056]NTX37156.1 alpha/beta hydrolase [Myxococcus sp. CA033]